MRLLEISIRNYKSLRSVTLKPGALSVFIGPNGAGKSNLCDALDFIGEMYRLGLELAVARHGGYENICYRHARRSKSPISLRVVVSLTAEEVLLRRARPTEQERSLRELVVDHRIALRAADQGIRAAFRIVEEHIEYSLILAPEGTRLPVLKASRKLDKIVDLQSEISMSHLALPIAEASGKNLEAILDDAVSSTDSFLRILELYVFPFVPLRQFMGSIELYQLNPRSCRTSGVPTPNPELHRDGENLPAVINALKSRNGRQFQTILDTLQVIMPTLEDIQRFSPDLILPAGPLRSDPLGLLPGGPLHYPLRLGDQDSRKPL